MSAVHNVWQKIWRKICRVSAPLETISLQRSKTQNCRLCAGNAEAVKVLLEYGAPRKASNEFYWHSNPLLSAVRSNSADCVQLIADQQPNDTCDCVDCEQLCKIREGNFHGICRPNTGFLKDLIKCKLGQSKSRPAQSFENYYHPGEGDLMGYVTTQKRIQAISQPAELTHPNFAPAGDTPLFLAVRSGCIGVVISLLYHGCDAGAVGKCCKK